MRQTLLRCEQFIEAGEFVQHVAINTAKLVALQDEPRLRDIVNGCGLVNADGQGVVWASRLLRDPLPGRVPGIDLMLRLLALADERGYRVYFLGARREVLERAVGRLSERYPKLTVAGFRDGYFTDPETQAVCEEIRASGSQMLFVAMPTPRKEYFLGDHGPELGVPFVMGVGGAIDVIAGLTRRAPVVLQRVGLEWLYRLLQEPRRLAPRYFSTNLRFAGLLVRSLASRR
jgi:N-acetylglucosaminyldiphosphoundecaprenol N-acetyl-beta-D-mannosaminyltransferase